MSEKAELVQPPPYPQSETQSQVVVVQQQQAQGVVRSSVYILKCYCLCTNSLFLRLLFLESFQLQLIALKVTRYEN